MADNIHLTEADVERVKDLTSGKAFFSEDIRQNYQAARLAVEPLIVAETFFDDLERVALGESFESVFLNADSSIQRGASAASD